MSKNTIVLDNPILINGKEVKELTYDATKITAEQFCTASAKAAEMDKERAKSFKAKENDYAFHLYLGFFAVVAENPGIDITDLERITGFDLLDFYNIGLFFILRKSAVPSGESDSENSSGSTADTSTPPSETSEA